MKHPTRALLLVLGSVFSVKLRLRHFNRNRISVRLASDPGKFYDSSNVDNVIDKLKDRLSAFSNKTVVDSSDDSSVGNLQLQFEQLLSQVRDAEYSDADKSTIFAESILLAREIERNTSFVGNVDRARTLANKDERTSLYSPDAAPVVVVYGPGSVARKLMDNFEGLGRAGQYKLINGSFLGSMQESELRFNLRGAKSLIIASAKTTEVASSGSSWFGGGGLGAAEESWGVLSPKTLKRLLNAVKTEQSTRPKEERGIKVVFLCNATKPPKSIASILGGDTTNLDSEAILLCTQRGLSYAVVRVGTLLRDGDAFPEKGSKVRSDWKNSIREDSSTAESQATESMVDSNPVIFALTSRIEVSERTRVSVAAEALMRSAVHYNTNSSFAVLSRPTPDGSILPTEEQWADEFLRLEGPELTRIPFRYASARQAQETVRRLAKGLLEPNTGLITPIDIEYFANGVRVLFRPSASGYLSAKEEREQQQKKEKEEEEAAAAAAAASKRGGGGDPRRQGAYTPPELSRDNSGTADVRPAKSASESKPVLEGGLEVVVDTEPYTRVRIRRCNMGPATVVKVESEAIILRALTRGLSALDKDYKILLTMDPQELWRTPKLPSA